MTSRTEDGGGDGADVVNAAEAQGNEQRQRCFRTVSGGAEGVEAKDGDAGSGANVLGAFFGGGQGAAEQQVCDLHEGDVIGPSLERYYFRCVEKK